MKKVLVTGSSGFIAYHVIENLRKSPLEGTGLDIVDPETPFSDCKYLWKKRFPIILDSSFKFNAIIYS